MSRLLLYRALASPPARSVMMLGDILGLQFEYRDVKLLQLEHYTPEYRKINPMGKVPVLQDGDFILAESHAILKYLVCAYGGAHLERWYPSELKARALVDQGLFFNCGFFFPKFAGVTLSSLIEGVSLLTPEHADSIDEAFGVIEAYLETRRYLAADRPTLADLSVGATTTAVSVLHKPDNNRFPRTNDWLKRLNEEPYFKNINAEGVAVLTKLLTRRSRKDKN